MMAGRLAASLRSLRAKSGRWGLESSTTSTARLERRKPVMKSGGGLEVELDADDVALDGGCGGGGEGDDGGGAQGG